MATATAIPTRRLISVDGLCALLEALWWGRLICRVAGKPEPLAQNGRPLRGGIAEKVFADINGVRQGMFIEGKDAAHPVLLWLHGGLPAWLTDLPAPGSGNR
jgi:hypothetical protein